MNILILTPVYFPITGGVSNVVRQLYHKAKSFGDSTFIITQVGSVSEESVDSEVVRLCIPDIPTLKNGFLAYSRNIVLRRRAKQKIEDLIKKNDTELVHIHCPVAKFQKVIKNWRPIFLTYHGSDVLQLYDSNANSIMKKINRRAHHVSAVSDALVHELRKEQPELNGRLSKVPNGKPVNLEIIVPIEKTQEYFLYVGDLLRNKAVDLILRAFGAINNCHKFKLCIVGDGPEKPELHRIVHELGLETDVQFYGTLPKEKVLGLMSNAYALILASMREGLPLVILEAFSFGCPVIASGVGGIPELVRHGENGLLFEPENIHALTECIRKIVSDKKTREQLSAGALRFVESYPTWDEVYLQYRNVYTKMLEEFRQ